ncbi:MAG: NAD(P)H-dependent oxidoreductase subunit E [Clostridia bacterium]|nr:NAD(P)H-dependent oxidoreductase subunit E [Clostridia bacterium]
MANACENCAEKRLIEETRELLSKHEKRRDSLIKILEEVQVKYGYIPKVCQLEISDYLDMPLAEIYGVITFYSRFSLEPKGKYNVAVCLGTACFVKGSKEILEGAKEKLGINEGETTKDGKFSIDTTRCVGACGLAPVFTINDEVYGNATVKKMNEVLDEYMNKE